MSEIRATTISDETGNGPIALTKQHAAKTWIRFNGTGTVAINDSFNVSSLSDAGTGDYRVTVVNSFTNANYSHVGAKQNVASNTDFGYVPAQGNQTSSVYNPFSIQSGGAADSGNMNGAVFGDLA